MGESISIGGPELGADIDLTGAWVTRFGSSDFDVLHERFENEEGRYRGGMHVCSHGFGTAVDPPHGSARNELWTPTRSRIPVMNSRPGKPSMGVVLEWMPDASTSCEGLRHTLEFAIMDRRSLRAELCIKNEDGGRTEFIAPGFHPYFNVDSSTSPEQVAAIYNPVEPGESYTSTRVDAEAELRGEERSFKEKLILGDNTTYVESNLLTIVTWSDDPSRYVCFEPTQAGALLKVEDGAVLLKRGEERRFFISLRTSAMEDRSHRLV